MENYRETHGRYPAPAIQGPDGKPLLSWPVAILPYLTEVELYQSFKLDEPWDGPHNKKLLDKMPRLFASPHPPGQAPGALTQLRIFVGKGTPSEGGQGARWEDISDGTDRTILIAEADEAVPWTKPEELPYAVDKPLPALGGVRAAASWSGWPTGVSWPSRRSLMRRYCVGRSPGTTSSRSIPIASGPASRFRLRRGVNRGREVIRQRPVCPVTAEPVKPARPGPAIGFSSAVACSTRMGSLLPEPPSLSFDPHLLYGSRTPGHRAGREPRRPAGPMASSKSSSTAGTGSNEHSMPDRFGPQVRTFPLIAATASPYGPNWVLLPKPETRADVMLQLVKDEIPIEGRILDLEGRPRARRRRSPPRRSSRPTART